MSRSAKKGPYIDYRLIRKLQNMKAGDKTAIKTWARAAVITPEMVGFRFGVHNGKTHIEILIVEDMVGHKLGEFSPTRKFTRHGGRMAREQEQAVAQKDAIGTKAAALAPSAVSPATTKGKK